MKQHVQPPKDADKRSETQDKEATTNDPTIWLPTHTDPSLIRDSICHAPGI
jgi:hypothetical protein